MKLFVWHGDGVLDDYTSGQITAIAPDLESALLAIAKERSYCMGNFPPHPTDIVDLSDVSNIEARAWVTWGGG